MWLLTVRRGRAGGLERTRRRRVWALWTEVVLKIVATNFAKPPTPINTTFLGIPPKCFARPAHSIFRPNPIPTLHSLLLNCCFASLGNKQTPPPLLLTYSATPAPTHPNHYIIAVSNNQLLKLFFLFWDVIFFFFFFFFCWIFWDVINKCNLVTISTRTTRVMIFMRFSVFFPHTSNMKQSNTRRNLNTFIYLLNNNKCKIIYCYSIINIWNRFQLTQLVKFLMVK